jgi:hypothetical protein
MVADGAFLVPPTRAAKRNPKDAIKMGRSSSGGRSMKNTECTIYITTKRGWTQLYRREKEGWTQTGPNGVVRPMTAEQLLSHILPALAAGVPGRLRVRVEPDGNTQGHAAD